MLQIRNLAAEELPILKDFAPPEWNVDLSALFARHFGQSYFHAIAAELDGRLVGCGNGLLHGKSGWLGNIIVLPEARGRGIGRLLTEGLVKFFQDECVEYQILVATSMGEPIYRKLGFTVSSQYVFLARSDAPAAADYAHGTRAIERQDEPRLFALDRAVTGETRAEFLRRYLDGGRVHLGASGGLDGYYLPALGTGLLIAANDEAGLALLHYRLRQPPSVAVVPEQNQVALDFLGRHGFVEVSRAPRMTLGPEIDWHPEHVYCRGSGFCG